ncbi:MAG: pseudouridine synthase [Lachnospiraceae bacterium]|nr:pseudouridine synthase [Lachnospiraceae bacterium]MBR4806914.1 pseudouridine synthase [Lachnospiraceae bacterium]
MDEMRINKFLSECGFCSRREADRLLEAGKVTVDGQVASLGSKLIPGQEVKVNGVLVTKKDRPVILALNKPKGIVCTTAKKEKNNVVDFIDYKSRIYPVGRLDKASEGLLLMTNMGDMVNKIMRARNYHEKEYLVSVDKDITDDFLKRMSEGVPVLDTITRPCEIEKIGRRKFRIILTQGLNRQIRRMCENLGYRVVYLKRTRIMNIKLGDLKVGEYRELTKNEIDEIMKQTEDDHGQKDKN